MQVHCPHDRMVGTKELKAHPQNRNRHPADQVERLAKILEYQGWRYPIKVSKRSGFITSGHGRLEAAKHLGWKEVPVSFQDYEDETQEYADVQFDNAIASWSELDLSAINSDIGDLGPDFDIDLLGIKDFVIEPADKLDPQCDEDEVPEALPEPKVVRGEVYVLGKHRLMCGDSTAITDVERLMEGKKPDAIYTDPPYGIAYKSPSGSGMTRRGDYAVLEGDQTTGAARDAIQIAAVIGARVQLFWGANHYSDALPNPSACWLVWDKRDGKQINNNSDCELAWVNLGGSARLFHHRWNGMIKASERGERRVHPTQKPVALAEWAFDQLEIGGSVLDLFGGSGSTAIACEKTGRSSYLMELDPHYCGVILDRWQKYTGKKAHREDGKPWDEIKAE